MSIELNPSSHLCLGLAQSHRRRPSWNWKASVYIVMKKENVAPDNYSFRICINAFGAMSDLERIGSVLQDMERRRDKAIALLKMSETRLVSKDGEGYNHLIMLYARLGNKTEVIRLWEQDRNQCRNQCNS
uniref:Pentatricopeptide repeat-containing protein, mitochondrial n=1 Tax=Noccaea caerulescens TaxID=107243 RepID=A0A1J3J1P7_NOCCA